jgi:cytochrome c nitrite reductase small subunit
MRRSNLSTIVFFSLLGLAIGLGAFTFLYAKGGSYLTNDPAACANCHVMTTHFDAWQKSSHKAVAVCNDCHTPHSFVPKYLVKANNGFWHSFAFTTGDFPDPLRIKPGNLKVTENACRSCHQEIVAAIETGPHLAGTGRTDEPDDPDEALSCVRCHRTVGHFVR